MADAGFAGSSVAFGGEAGLEAAGLAVIGSALFMLSLARFRKTLASMA